MVLIPDICLNFLIGSFGLGGGGVQLIQVQVDLYGVIRFLLGQKNYRLNMLRAGEHVHGRGAQGPEPVLGQVGEVAGEGGGIAGDVHHALGRKRADGAQEVLVAAAAGRVHEEHVERLPRFGHAQQEAARVCAVELRVADAVPARVPRRILYGGRVELHADQARAAVRGTQPDGADAAIGVQDRLRPLEAGVVQGARIEALGLLRIDLIKGLRRDAERLAAEHVLYGSRAVEDDVALAQDHGGRAVVDVEDNGSDLRVRCEQRPHKVVLARQNRLDRDQHHQDLARRPRRPDQDVPHQARARVLPVRPDLEFAQQPPDRRDDRVRLLVLDQALVHGHDLMRPHAVDARDHVAAAVPGKDRMRLVAVVEGILHPHDVLHRAERREELAHPRLLSLKLLRIGQMRHLASAAARSNRAGKSNLSAHAHPSLFP